MTQNKEKYKICIIGLGYVGLPLATRFSLKGYNVVGYDINERRIEELTNQFDKNDDVTKDSLTILNNKAKLTSNILDINDSNIFIVTVPTPINKDKTPDLNPLINSTKLIGKIMTKGSIVIYESTVYPGVTDEVCTPILEEESKLTFNKDFSTGYSPERIVPGDKVNTIEKIKKIVSGSNAEALKVISALYSSIIDAGIHEAQSIKVAEAAKVTENIQRDVNIALINELHQLYSSLNIDTNHVIEAASTKWNFMKLSPGLVGGHCISIDPYYLMHKSEISGYIPAVMSAARNVNDQMDKWVLSNFLKFATKKNIDLSSVTVTILGYTFKENCSDTRNTKVYDLATSLKSLDVNIDIWDPFIDLDTQMKLKEIGIEAYTEQPRNIQLGFVCVYHDQILEFLNSFDGIIYDYKRPISV